MASNRIGFNQFLKKVSGEKDLNILIDSNVLIANFDETHTNYETVSEFLDQLDKVAEVNYFTTVTTKADRAANYPSSDRPELSRSSK